MAPSPIPAGNIRLWEIKITNPAITIKTITWRRREYLSMVTLQTELSVRWQASLVVALGQLLCFWRLCSPDCQISPGDSVCHGGFPGREASSFCPSSWGAFEGLCPPIQYASLPARSELGSSFGASRVHRQVRTRCPSSTTFSIAVVSYP
jgi:hypothetical protein